MLGPYGSSALLSLDLTRHVKWPYRVPAEHTSLHLQHRYSESVFKT